MERSSHKKDNSLKAAENAFISASNQKSEEKTVQTNDSEAATELLQEMFPALTNLIALLQLYSQFEPAIYGEIYNLVVTYITETNTAARARNTRKKDNNTEVQETVQTDVKQKKLENSGIAFKKCNP